jgi:DNA-binding response OmpR family regulator
MPKKILVIDDDTAINTMLQRKFREDGFSVKGCFNGQQGIDALKEEKFDGIVLDLVMPLKGGLGVLSEKGETMNAETPTYILTSLNVDDQIDQAQLLGAKEIFRKIDMTPAKVVSAISKELVSL